MMSAETRLIHLVQYLSQQFNINMTYNIAELTNELAKYDLELAKLIDQRLS